MKLTSYLKLYLGFVFVYLMFTLFNNDLATSVLKPFILAILAIPLFKLQFETKNILLTALFFSWMGDVLLIFVQQNQLFFIFGLVSFLISHLFYIYLFFKQRHEIISFNMVFFIAAMGAVTIYLVYFLNTLYPFLNELKIPVTVYASVISLMLLMAYRGTLVWNRAGKNRVFLGALFFVISDSILAYNKFCKEIFLGGFFIMLTYTLAQFMIFIGILNLNKIKIKD